jgi:hypothetical protein
LEFRFDADVGKGGCVSFIGADVVGEFVGSSDRFASYGDIVVAAVVGATVAKEAEVVEGEEAAVVEGEEAAVFAPSSFVENDSLVPADDFCEGVVV